MHIIVETEDIYNKRQGVILINKETGEPIVTKDFRIEFRVDRPFSYYLDGKEYILDGVNNSVEFITSIEDHLEKKLFPEPENIQLPTPPVNRIHLKKGLEAMKDFKGFYEGGPITIIMYIHEDEVKVDKLGFPAEDAKLSAIFLCTEHTGYVEVMGTSRLQ